MSPTYSLEIVPLELTDTGLRLRTRMAQAQSYDVVLRREGEGGSEFVSRTPAESAAEAEGVVRDLIDTLDGEVSVIGDMASTLEVCPAPPSDEGMGFRL